MPTVTYSSRDRRDATPLVTIRDAIRPGHESAARPNPASRLRMAFLLIVGAGTVHEIPHEGLVIGRDPECGIVLESLEVSRRHARVAPSVGGYTIVDESTNGVFVNGEQADHSQRLTDGDVVRIGDVILRFSAGPVAHVESGGPDHGSRGA